MPKPIGIGRWVVRVLAVGYVLALLAVILAFRVVGERWWVTAAGLYLPRVGFALPLPFVALLAAFTRSRRLIVSQALAAVLVVFPIMGLHLGLRLPGRSTPAPGAFHLRVMSYNVDSSAFGTDAIAQQIRDTNPDLVLLQEAHPRSGDLFKAQLPGYTFHAQGQFIVASRFPIDDVYAPPRIPHRGHMRSPRWMRYRVTTPAGPIQVYNVHPISPREELDELHGEGLRSEIMSGHIFAGAAADDIMANATLRMAQLEQITLDAAQASGPILIAGDTNLPELSWAKSHWLGTFQDGFSEAGRGFGYTFPAPRHPWMRIDRILTNERFRFLDFSVSKVHTSDHRAVVAELELTR